MSALGERTALVAGVCGVLVLGGVGAHVLGSGQDTPVREPSTPIIVENNREASHTDTVTDPDDTEPRTTNTDEEQTTVLFVGDIFLDRYIRQMAERYGDNHTFGCVADFLQNVDMVVGNLEGPITDHTSRSMGTRDGASGHYVFTFPTSSAPLLARYNIRLVNLGNNHIGNFGNDGIASTRAYLDGSGVGHFGGIGGDEPVHRDGGLSFVSYNQFGGQSSGAVARVIKKERTDGQRVIVYAHWGEEYVTSPGYLRSIANTFVEAGAQLIVGSHPHVVIPMEYIEGVPVHYSLGNFIFDQYFSDDVMGGLAVLVAISDTAITTKTYPLLLQPNGSVCLAGADGEVGR